MSKLFTGNYVKLDDDVSFQLIRTNPRLTTNTKLVYDGEKLYFDAYNANNTLGAAKFHNVKVRTAVPYNHDLSYFLKGSSDNVFDLYQNLENTELGTTFDDQFENMYWCGAESINSTLYPEEMGFIAPLYLRKKLPNYFVVFKVPGPTSFNMNLPQSERDNYEFSFTQDILKNATILKTFDLRAGSTLGDYIRKYTEQKNFEYDRSIYVNFSSKEITYYGIDKASGVLTSKTENIDRTLVRADSTIMHDDNWITEGFVRNGLIFPYILNLEFLFDDNETPDYKFGRYIGLYCNDIDMFDFEATYNRNGLVIDEPETVLCETIVRTEKIATPEQDNISIIFKKDNDLSELEMSENSVYYVKDKFDKLHRVGKIYKDNTDTWTKSDSKMEITDHEFDLSSIMGFELVSTSARCERIESDYIEDVVAGKATLGFEIKKMFDQGEEIVFYNNAYDEDGARNVIVRLVADTALPAGTHLGSRFSCNGNVDDMTIAICDVINNLDSDHSLFTASHNGTYIVIRAKFSGEAMNEYIVPAFDNTLITNKKVVFDDLTGRKLIGGTDYADCIFKIEADSAEQFAPGRYLKTLVNKNNSKIIAVYPYENDDTGEVDRNYCYVTTDENGSAVVVSNTNHVEIIDRYYPKFGMLSFFPVKDFDFDNMYSTYGVNTAFENECRRMNEYAQQQEDQYDLTKLAVSRFADDNGTVIETEYDYYMENLIPELSTINKSAPHIVKWGYYDDQKDSCENPYRLNFSKIFGVSNMSANTYLTACDINQFTHSMPYYLSTLDVKKESDSNFSGMDYTNEYQYVYDSLGVYSGYVNTLSDETNDFESYIQQWITKFMDTKENNFDKLLSDRRNENYSKRFCKKYSRMDFGNEKDTFSNTLFRGVKFRMKEIISGNENFTSKYNGYKFSFLYIPIELKYTAFKDSVYFVKNDTFKFIVGMVFVNTMSGINGTSEYILDSPYGIEHFNKAYVYGGCYDSLKYPVRESVITDGNPESIQLGYLPLDHVFSYIKDGDTIDVSNLRVIDNSILLMLRNLDDKNCISQIVIHSLDNSIRKTFTNIEVENNVNVVLYNMVKSTIINTFGKKIYVDITFNDKYDSSGISVLFKNYYSVFKNISAAYIKEYINNDDNVFYYSTSDDVYKMEIIDPASFNTYDIHALNLVYLNTIAKNTRFDSTDIRLKDDVRGLGLIAINRYSGYYNPIFNDVVMFNDFVDPESEEALQYSNTEFDADYADNYGSFGIVKNMWFHRVNIHNNDELRRQLTTMPVRPLLNQFALDCRDYNIFESNWDPNYYTEQTDIYTSEKVHGTRCMKNKPCMFGSKYMNVPETITIEDCQVVVDWDDEFVSNQYSTDAEVMVRELNSNTVNYFLFLHKRLVRYFIESEMTDEFKTFINPFYSYGDITTVKDDLEAYVEKNILKLYRLDSIKMWVKRKKEGVHDSAIENDYVTYISKVNSTKKKNGLKDITTFSIDNIDADQFNRKITYRLQTGYKEDFGFSFVFKKI